MAARLRRTGLAVDVLTGRDAADSTRLAHAAVGAGTAAVVVCGGDGLVHRVLPALTASAVPLGIVPTGTGNDTALSLGLPADPWAATDAVADALRAGTTRDVDVGRAVLADGSVRYWTTVLCCGFDAAVAERAARLRRPRGPRRYDLAIAAETVRLRARPVTLDVDGTRVSAPVLLVALGNGRWYGGGKQIAPHASMTDGRLSATVVGPVTRRTLARLAPLLPRAGHVGHPRVTTFDARTVTISSPAALTAWADGEPLGPLPVTATTVAGALRVLVPTWCR